MRDLIERQAAIAVASRECHELRGVFSDIEHGLKELPSAQPRKGKWIDDGTEFGCCCSECGSTLDDYFDGLTEDVRLIDKRIDEALNELEKKMREHDEEKPE